MSAGDEGVQVCAKKVDNVQGFQTLRNYFMHWIFLSFSPVLFKATNDDATSCKLSAVNLGYWRDPFVQVCPTSYIRSNDPECNIYSASSSPKHLQRNISHIILVKLILSSVDGKAGGPASTRDQSWLLCSGCGSQVGHDG